MIFNKRVNRNSSYSDDEEENMEDMHASTKNSFAKNENFWHSAEIEGYGSGGDVI